MQRMVQGCEICGMQDYVWYNMRKYASWGKSVAWRICVVSGNVRYEKVCSVVKMCGVGNVCDMGKVCCVVTVCGMKIMYGIENV